MKIKRIVFLVSGGGGTLKFVYHALKELNLPFEIIGILSDRTTDIGIFASETSIYYNQINYKKSEPKQLQEELRHLSPDLIITNFHKILDSQTLDEFSSRFINLHYSLLPSFSGLIGMKTLEKAKEHNVGFIGASCHEVIEEVDAGKIIHQGCFPVDWEKDTNQVDTVFKTSCLVILGGIATKTKFKLGSTTQVIINEKSVHFSPELPLSNLEFSDKFWKQLIN